MHLVQAQAHADAAGQLKLDTMHNARRAGIMLAHALTAHQYPYGDLCVFLPLYRPNFHDSRYFLLSGSDTMAAQYAAQFLPQLHGDVAYYAPFMMKSHQRMPSLLLQSQLKLCLRAEQAAGVAALQVVQLNIQRLGHRKSTTNNNNSLSSTQ
jgi:hypothetical protein